MNRIKAGHITVRTASGSLYEFKNAIAERFNDLISVVELEHADDRIYFITHMIESISFKEVDYEQD